MVRTPTTLLKDCDRRRENVTAVPRLGQCLVPPHCVIRYCPCQTPEKSDCSEGVSAVGVVGPPHANVVTAKATTHRHIFSSLQSMAIHVNLLNGPACRLRTKAEGQLR